MTEALPAFRPSDFFTAKCVIRQRFDFMKKHGGGAAAPRQADEQAVERMRRGDQFEEDCLKEGNVPPRLCDLRCQGAINNPCESVKALLKAVKKAQHEWEKAKEEGSTGALVGTVVNSFQQLHLYPPAELQGKGVAFSRAFADLVRIEYDTKGVVVHVLDCKYSAKKSEYQEKQVVCYILYINHLLWSNKIDIAPAQLKGSVILPREHADRKDKLTYSGMVEKGCYVECPISSVDRLRAKMVTYFEQILPNKLGQGWRDKTNAFVDMEDTDWKFIPGYCEDCPHLADCQAVITGKLTNTTTAERCLPTSQVVPAVHLPGGYSHSHVFLREDGGQDGNVFTEEERGYIRENKNIFVLDTRTEAQLREMFLTHEKGVFYSEGVLNLDMAVPPTHISELSNKIYVMDTFVKELFPRLPWKGPLSRECLLYIVSDQRSGIPANVDGYANAVERLYLYFNQRRWLFTPFRYPKTTPTDDWSVPEQLTQEVVLQALMRQLHYEARGKVREDGDSRYLKSIHVRAKVTKPPECSVTLSLHPDSRERNAINIDLCAGKKTFSGTLLYKLSKGNLSVPKKIRLEAWEAARLFQATPVTVKVEMPEPLVAEGEFNGLLLFYSDGFMSNEVLCRPLVAASHVYKMDHHCTLAPYILGNETNFTAVAPWGSVYSDARREQLRQYALPGATTRQQEAYQHVLSDCPLTVLWGPPGTGKTTILAQILSTLSRAAEKPLRILIVACTNDALGLLQGRMKKEGVSGTYLGREKKNTAFEPVVFSTIFMLCKEYYFHDFRQNPFDMVVIDEASMFPTTEAAVVAQFLKPQQHKILLGGDHRQLGPILADASNDPHYLKTLPQLRHCTGSVLDAVMTHVNVDHLPAHVIQLDECFRSPANLIAIYNELYPLPIRAQGREASAVLYKVVIPRGEMEEDVVARIAEDFGGTGETTFVVTPHRVQRAAIQGRCTLVPSPSTLLSASRVRRRTM
ncbi:hypothetical protein AGDE_14660 [Angomonas deanei]|uniref:AAA domain/Type III restriction enzyme, res subunit/Uncharacterized conserved protein (DUF2075), putative n=1 Tax=Angomonas deanei TaxID=59799 RepID=A0A7G2CHL7_9TRYP|nr:hypothetical protein AGDE_14660 [Angomonas deanei]CAD2217712.1 AAA domain/Type III restriction enzyme, res subunit/Uncharacterized conserved protein (DUF2075), putative [Angomonas deanei]|eukprot:EPY20458.1 hypothetical protein AGDE_14660 [Angomonas deanei]